MPWKNSFSDSADCCSFAKRNKESWMLVEVSSRTIIQFLEMFMDLGDQREADLKCICGYVKRGHKERDDVWFCVLGRQLKGVTVSCRLGVGWRFGAGAAIQIRMQVLIHWRIEFLGMCRTH